MLSLPHIHTFACDLIEPLADGRVRLGSVRGDAKARERAQERNDTTAYMPDLLKPTRNAADLFEHNHDKTDEHLTLYTLVDREGQYVDQGMRFSSIAVSMWPQFAAVLNGASLRGVALALDFDSPGKQEWNDALRADCSKLFAELAERGHLLAKPSVFYTTKHGYRLVYFLSDHVPICGPGGLLDLLLGLLMEAVGSGLEADPTCSDWTRLFRLSRVFRRKPDEPADAGHFTWERDYYRQSWGKVDFTARDQSSPTARYLVHHPTAFVPASQRTEAQLRAGYWPASSKPYDRLLKRAGKVNRAGGRKSSANIGSGLASTEWQRHVFAEDNKSPNTHSKALKKELLRAGSPTSRWKGDDEILWAHAVLFESAPLWPGIASGEAGMHAALVRLSQVLCRALYSRLDPSSMSASAQFLHAHILRVAIAANTLRPPERQDADDAIAAEAWNALSWSYAITLGRKEQDSEDTQEEAEREQERQINAFRLQKDEKEKLKQVLLDRILTPCPEAVAWVEANYQNMYIVDGPDGLSVVQRRMDGGIHWTPPCSRERVLPSLIRDSKISSLTAFKPSRNPADPPVYKNTSQMVDEYGMGTALSRASRSVAFTAPELRWNDGKMDVTFVEKWGGMRKDIPATYHAGVDDWVRALAGSQELYEHLCDWLHFYPQLEHRTCALYLYGNSDIGKTVLGKALKSLTEFNESAPVETAMEDFQEVMKNTPFLWSDEFARTFRDQSRTLVDLLKRMVDGSGEAINQKGKARVRVEGHWRILFTANDKKVLKVGTDIAPATITALGPRLMYLHGDPAAGKFKKYMMPERWAEDAIPRHVMWLRHNWAVKHPGVRYAKDGFWSKEHGELMTNSVEGNFVMESLGRVLSSPVTPPTAHVFKVHDGALWVNAPSLAQFVQGLPQGIKISSEKVRQTLLQYEVQPRVERTIYAGHKSVFMFKVDAKRVLEYMSEHDQECDLRQHLPDEALWHEWAPPKMIARYKDAPIQKAAQPRAAKQAAAPTPPPGTVINAADMFRPVPPQVPMAPPIPPPLPPPVPPALQE